MGNFELDLRIELRSVARVNVMGMHVLLVVLQLQSVTLLACSCGSSKV